MHVWRAMVHGCLLGRKEREEGEGVVWGDNPDVKTYSGSILGLMS